MRLIGQEQSLVGIDNKFEYHRQNWAEHKVHECDQDVQNEGTNRERFQVSDWEPEEQAVGTHDAADYNLLSWVSVQDHEIHCVYIHILNLVFIVPSLIRDGSRHDSYQALHVKKVASNASPLEAEQVEYQRYEY